MYEHCIFPDARRVAPISGSVLCLSFVLELCACVLCLSFVLAFCAWGNADDNVQICRCADECANAQICADKKASLSCDTERGCENKVGGDLLSRGCAVPSARLGLTSLFGMGRGDPQRYNHQNIVWTTQAELANTFMQATLAAASAATVHFTSCTALCTNFEQARPVRRGRLQVSGN